MYAEKVEYVYICRLGVETLNAQNVAGKLGKLLQNAGFITQQQLEAALAQQRKTGERLGQILVAKGFLDERSLLEALEFQLGIPHVDLSRFTISQEALSTLPESLARRYGVIPLLRRGENLLVAMSDPLNIYVLDALRSATGFEIEPALASAREISAAIERAYRQVSAEEPKVQEETVAATSEAMEGPVARAVNTILERAVRERASDLHLEPSEGQLRIRMRVDGFLRDAGTQSASLQAPLISRLKVMANLDIAEKRLPQDGRFFLTIDGRNIDFRLSTLPTMGGEKVAIRILDRRRDLLHLSQLHFAPGKLERFKSLLKKPYGIILVTGPTGSGKTTTLYAALGDLDAKQNNIVTVEDPVEYTLEGINQVQVNPRFGLTFANGLRALVRQDPDVIMVGEIRDRETAQIAIEAALTGHLVLSTLHTNDATGAVARLIEMGIEPFLISSAILGVVAQRLVRCLCPECRLAREITEAERKWLLELGGEDLLAGKTKLYEPQGCPGCGFTGFQGRAALQEILVPEEGIWDSMLRGAPASQIRGQAIKSGMEPMALDGCRKALSGLTSLGEVIRVTQVEGYHEA